MGYLRPSFLSYNLSYLNFLFFQAYDLSQLVSSVNLKSYASLTKIQRIEWNSRFEGRSICNSSWNLQFEYLFFVLNFFLQEYVHRPCYFYYNDVIISGLLLRYLLWSTRGTCYIAKFKYIYFSTWCNSLYCRVTWYLGAWICLVYLHQVMFCTYVRFQLGIFSQILQWCFGYTLVLVDWNM